MEKSRVWAVRLGSGGGPLTFETRGHEGHRYLGISFGPSGSQKRGAKQSEGDYVVAERLTEHATITKPIMSDVQVPRILIVDDSRDNRALLEVLLQGLRCEFRMAEDGMTALTVYLTKMAEGGEITVPSIKR